MGECAGHGGLTRLTPNRSPSFGSFRLFLGTRCSAERPNKVRPSGIVSGDFGTASVANFRFFHPDGKI